MGATTFAVNDADFIVRDSTDSTTNYIWRDHSASKLYLGTPDAVVTPRSHVLPSTDSAYDLGATGTRWANVYADTLYGNGANLTGINTDLVSDTSPQLGGNLDTNGRNIQFGHASTHNDDTLRFGANGNDLYINHGGNAVISAETGSMYIRNTGSFSSTRKVYIMGKVDEQSVTCESDGPVELYYDNVKKAETTSYGTKVTGYQSSTTFVGFVVRGDLNNYGFGTDSGSSITNFDLDYYSPIPMFGSRTVQSGSSYLSFPSYASGNYIKFTAPVSGLYQFELVASVEVHSGGDWLAFSWEKNVSTAASGTEMQSNFEGACAIFERVGGTDAGMGNHFSTTRFLSANDYVVLYQQSAAAVRFKNAPYLVRGHLIH